MLEAPRKPELMSPVGHWPQLHAAIEAGADAVYFGLKHFSARAKTGFSLDELPEVMRTLHARGVRGFITFNTLVFEHELLEAARTIASIVEAGADALIVQDYGIVKLIRQIAPDVELHASTQTSITNVEGVELAQSFGVNRVNLARELSLDEVRAIVRKTGCEVEMFVHGALCVAYSGQCFSSEAWGGRSANRGQCAQACRLPYEMLVDGRLESLGDARYLLSPGDLFALEQVPEILEIGVAALKIEGRYKDADYVALTTRAYRKAVDEAWAGRKTAVEPSERLRLEQVYSRGLGPFFMTGTNHQLVVNGRAPRHRGVFMGRVERLEPDRVVLESSEAHDIAPLKPGDGVVFDAADWRSPEEPEEGGRVYQVAPASNGRLELRFGNGAIRFERIRPGDRVWRTNDPELERVARPYTQASAPVSRQPVAV
ncbi:MAG: peptidase U32 family protein, partial [Bryobacteraceae bacterium]